MNSSDGKLKYDYIAEHHHHLYDIDNDEIKDYPDNELDEILKNYFKEKSIDGYVIEDIKLEIKVKKTK
jgi:Fur family peroxide stress response transcriptional regulator